MIKILLKFDKTNPVIWQSKKNIDETINEEPLTLEFNQKLYYFYSEGIKIHKNIKSKKWINFKTQLDFFQQNKILESFSKFTDQTNFDQKIILLELKFKVLLKKLKYFKIKLNEINKISNLDLEETKNMKFFRLN